MIKKEELPENVGLIYYDSDTKNLRIAKKALYRQIEEPVGVYKYIIFSKLEEDRIPFYEDRAEYAKDYLEDKVVKKYIGDRLGTKLSKDLQDAYERLEKVKNKELELETWQKVKKILDAHNILPWRWWDKDDWLKELERALSGKCNSIDLEVAISQAKNLLSRLEKMQVKEETDD